jgi:hypothetical protein
VKLGIMQPYFFPYLGHFALIAHSDLWVVFDVTQYTPKSWMSRNRVLHPQSGWNYINVPLVNSSISITTREARVQDLQKTRASVLGKLTHYRRKAPYYEQVVQLVNRAFDAARDDSLVALNVSGLAAVCSYLELPFDYRICSELGLELDGIDNPGGWAPAISRQLGASFYLNPAGGRALFDPQDFSRHGIGLGFLQFDEFRYDTAPYSFEPGLSVLDVLMWNSPRTVRQVLASHSHILEP